MSKDKQKDPFNKEKFVKALNENAEGRVYSLNHKGVIVVKEIKD